MTFWQGLVISLLASTTAFGKTPSKESDQADDPDIWGKQAQNFLVCLEMLLFSIAHFYCFPTEEWDPGYRPMMEKKAGVGELAFGDFITDLKLIFSGDLKKTLKTKNLTKSYSVSIDDDDENVASVYASINEKANPLGKQDQTHSFEDDSIKERNANYEDSDTHVDLEHQLATSISKGLDSEDPIIRNAANRVMQSVQAIQEKGDDELKDSFHDADGSDFVHHDGYGSIQKYRTGSPEYETFNPLQSFSKYGSVQDKVKDVGSQIDQSGSFLLNPLQTFVKDDTPLLEEYTPSLLDKHQIDDHLSESSSLLTNRNQDDESIKVKNVSLRPSIFTQHDD